MAEAKIAAQKAADKAAKEAVVAEKKLAEDTAAAGAAGLTLEAYQAQQIAPVAKAAKKDGPITVHFPATGATRTFLPEHAHDGMSHADLAEACRTNPSNGKEGVYLEE